MAFDPDPVEGVERITFREDNGMTCFAEWVDPSGLDRPGGLPLFPSGLKAHLRRT
ncbi:hypothetical protein [Palleronia abyssalis]|uniref:hypothetical protein n=1 Tax=Palleronia abyssalis TaxID=1501240 RepID=UPI001FEB59A6|nr:hypothetical protein [Palleronia abyssalis]